MNKSRLSKKNQEKVSKICQECGQCCKNQRTDWFMQYSTPADWKRWASEKGIWLKILGLIRKSIERERRRDKYINGGCEKEDKNVDDCGCLGRERKSKKTTYFCIIERDLGFKYKPYACRDYECSDKLKGAVKQ